MKNYTVSEFRKDLRNALNSAESGEKIYIERHGVQFILLATENTPLKFEGKPTAPTTPFYDEVGFVSEKDLEKIKIGKEVTVASTPSGKKNKSVGFANTEKLQKFAAEKGIKFCPNGHAIPEGRSKCMGKGCKYA